MGLTRNNMSDRRQREVAVLLLAGQVDVRVRRDQERQGRGMVHLGSPQQVRVYLFCF